MGCSASRSAGAVDDRINNPVRRDTSGERYHPFKVMKLSMIGQKNQYATKENFRISLIAYFALREYNKRGYATKENFRISLFAYFALREYNKRR